MRNQAPFGVIFDMDGVLVDSAEAHLQSWQQLAAENGTQITREQFHSTFGRQNRDIVPLFFGPVSESRLRMLADRKEELYRARIKDDPPALPGAVELVSTLAAEGLRLAVGSSGPRANVELVLFGLRIHHWFSALVCAEDVTRGKPDPEVFLTAAARLELPPGQCIVIEDAPAGIQAANAAGTRSLALLSTHSAEAFDHGESRPTARVLRLSEISPDTLRGILESPNRE